MNITKPFVLALLYLIAIPLQSFSQKQPLDSTAYKNWISLDWGSKISNDGNFVVYSIQNEPIGSYTLMVKNLQTMRELSIPDAQAANASFTQNSRFLLFREKGSRIGIIDLKTLNVTYKNAVSQFTLPEAGNGEWYAYQKEGPEHNLILADLKNNSEKAIPNVQDYKFNYDGSLLALNISICDNSRLQIINLKNLSSQIVWSGLHLKDMLFDINGQSLVFLTESSKNETIINVKHFGAPSSKTDSVITYKYGEIQSFKIDNFQKFTQDGKGLLVSLKKKQQKSTPDSLPESLILWSYMDAKLPTEQLKELDNRRSYQGYLNLTTKHIVPLEGENDEIEIFVVNKNLGGIALISQTFGNPGRDESNWNIAAERTWYLRFANTNKRIELPQLKNYPGGSVKFSPDGSYLVYYCPKSASYFSYEISSGRIRNITNQIETCWLSTYGNDLPLNDWNTRGIGGWVAKKHGVLIYDNKDIWLVDLQGAALPVNLTQSVKLHLDLRFNLEVANNTNDYSDNDKLILNAFNSSKKENGFFLKRLNAGGPLVQLSMGPYIYNLAGNPYVQNDANFSCIKAKDKQVYLLKRMSEKESPNLYITKDFKKFTLISNIYPEKKYNWLTTELHTWKSLDGKQLQGILYKPENFDSTKKYPVIFHYYERKSDGLHYFLQPENLTNGCAINIPSYVSNGYLVFSPDIYYTLGDPMQGTYDAVVSAAKFVSKFPFADSTRMGLQGCSFGAIQTDYLITHSKLFSAAASASGMANFITSSGSIMEYGSSNRGFFEIGQLRMKYTLWERPDLYMKNSSLLNADKVTTPLLMMHTTKDGISPIEDAREFFTALRRLGKKAWLLEYQDGNHGIWGKSGDDFSIRMQQFFDHYLKDKPAPIWMTRGIPADKRGIETGLELEPPGVTPGPGLLDTTRNKLPKTK